MSRTTPSDDAAFVDLFDTFSATVYAYARRHIDADSAYDVVSEVFVAAWRRSDALPDDALPWLLVTARNVIANQVRSLTRQQRLARHLAGVERAAGSSGADPAERAALVEAFARLRLDDREALLLVGWDGLTPTAAAQVLGCSPGAFTARLHRARRRFDELLKTPTGGDSTPETPALRLVTEGDLR